MPFAQADLEKFVTDLGLPADKAKVVLDAIGSDEGVRNKFGDNVLRQSDYSAKMGDLQKEKDRLEAEYQEKVKKEETFHASLVGWKTEKEREAERIITEARQAAESKLSDVQKKVRELAQRNGIPEEEIKDLVAASTVENRRTPNDDQQPHRKNGEWMSKEEFRNEAKFYARLPAIQMSLEREYFRLFGQDAPDINWEKVIDGAQSSKRSLQQEFEATYKLPEKRAEVAETKRKKEIEEAEKRGAEQARAKLMEDNPELAGRRSVTRDHRGSPILDQAREHAKKDQSQHTAHGPQDAVSAAVKAFNEGKYREGQAA